MSFPSLIVVLFAALLQDPPQRELVWVPEEVERPPELDEKEAAEGLRAFEEALAGDEAAQLKALEELVARGRHETWVKSIASVLSRNRSPKVRELAARSLGRMGYSSALKPLFNALVSKGNEDAPLVREAAGEALGLVAEKSLVPLVEREFQNGDKHTKLGLILAFGHMKDHRAALWVAPWLDPPTPASVNSPNNPPASYWEARWKEWQYLRDAADWALFAMSGEIFENERAVKEWVKRRGWLKRKGEEAARG